MTALLGVKNLSKHFGGLQAVADVSLTVTSGEICSVIGPNGAGKTTLFNMISGVLRPSGGRITFDGTAQKLTSNEDVQEFYLGVSGSGRKSLRDVKHYKRRKRWLS